MIVQERAVVLEEMAAVKTAVVLGGTAVLKRAGVVETISRGKMVHLKNILLENPVAVCDQTDCPRVTFRLIQSRNQIAVRKKTEVLERVVALGGTAVVMGAIVAEAISLEKTVHLKDILLENPVVVDYRTGRPFVTLSSIQSPLNQIVLVDWRPTDGYLKLRTEDMFLSSIDQWKCSV